jgi:hypothetical protein
MARLTAAQRKALPDSAFAGPGRTFPIPDKDHARAALMLAGHASKGYRNQIRREAYAKLKK